ncbi:MAG: potassium-transporting ATPase subunit KdpA [Chthoniobacteraceae bacterium]|nr:potassium-transporting ATPase subunit KdpA [Chthoniobacteraceae bacterium]
MNQRDFVQLAVFLGGLFAVTPFLGRWMADVVSGEKSLPFLKSAESLIYRLAGIEARKEMGWKHYLGALLAFNTLGIIAVLVIEMTQAWLPFNPQHLANLPFPLAFSTAVSFVTNTNWQAYSGEATMSYGTQMFALCVQNFLSAATGMAVAIALIRGLTRRSSGSLGNFWADLTRGTLYVLLPLSFLFALVLVGQGVVQSLAPYAEVTTLEGAKQTIPLGPAASQVAIKQIGTNGGGFFGQNSAHPFENSTPLTNFLEIFVIFAIPAGLTYTFGVMAGNRRQGWAIFGAMLALFLIGFAVAWPSELAHDPATGLTASMEGKETRFGIMNSVLFATVTTDASCGAVNAMHDSLAPLAGMVALVNMMLGEVVFGGVGAGLYGMLIFAILTVFIAGLMVGRTPEYLGKKIEAREITWAVVAVLVPAVAILAGTAIGCITKAGVSSIANPGPHGFTEILYAFTSAVANNGSAFAGLNANTNFYNYLTALGMLVGRFAVIVPVLAIAGNLAAKQAAPPSAGTFPTDSVAFALLLMAVVLIVGALTFFPALSLGPVVEHLLAQAGRTF